MRSKRQPLDLDKPTYTPVYLVMTVTGETKARYYDRDQATAEAKRLGLRMVMVAEEDN